MSHTGMKRTVGRIPRDSPFLLFTVDLSLLVQKLMAMTDVDNEREKMTCIALIAKALLQESWADYSILVYLDMIREVKVQKGFVIPASGEGDTLTPANIVNYNKKQETPVKIHSEQGKQEPFLVMPVITKRIL